MALFTGNIRFTSTDAAQDDNKGNVYYDDSESQLKHYDGSNWGRVSRDLTWGITPGYGPYTSDAYTVLLIHSDNADTSTAFADSGSNGHTITAVADAQHKTATKKIGGSSIYFDGDGDYILVNDSDDFFLGTGSSGSNTNDFTIDFWINLDTDDAVGAIFGQANIDDNRSDAIRMSYAASENISGLIIEGEDDNASIFFTRFPWNYQANRWYHIAVIRVEDQLKWFVDGMIMHEEAAQPYANNADAQWANYDGPLSIGANPWDSSFDRLMTGYIDEFRISKGIARWTSNFTVY